MRLTDAGVKSVLFGMYKHSGYCVVLVDRVTGYWELTSASIQTRRLKTRPG